MRIFRIGQGFITKIKHFHIIMGNDLERVGILMSKSKQTYSPLVPPKGCPSIYPRHTKCPSEPKQLVSDHIQGMIQQKCDGKPIEYWKIIGFDEMPAGTITVSNTSPCTMVVQIDKDGNGIADFILFSISDSMQSRSATVKKFSNLVITCYGDGVVATGKYCLSINYRT